MITTETMTRKKTRLIVRKRDENIALPVEEIAYIYRNDLLVLVVDHQEKKYFCDKNLGQLESELDPAMFLRANRQYILNINYVKSFKAYDKVKLEVILKIPQNSHQIIISQKMAPVFRKWISEE